MLKRLAGIEAAVDARHLGGRVGWRCHSDDRLPLIGALAADLADERGAVLLACAAPPLVGEKYLFALTVLACAASRAALDARVLAAWVCEAPMPVDTDLLDADAARHLSRSLARGAGRPRFDARADAHAPAPHPSPLLPHEGAILRPARAGEGDP
ncbi:MAG: hypothetical protein U1F67_02875 [Rubrivivax sp.]